jgi:hypothetical protein
MRGANRAGSAGLALAAALALAACSQGGGPRDASSWPDTGNGAYSFGGCQLDAGPCDPQTLRCALDIVRSAYFFCVEDYDCERVLVRSSCVEMCDPQVVYADDAVTFSDRAAFEIGRFCGQPDCAGKTVGACPPSPGAPVCRAGRCEWAPESADGGRDAGEADAAADAGSDAGDFDAGA